MSIITRSIPVLAATATLGLSAAPALANTSSHGRSHGHGSSSGQDYGSHFKGKRICGLDRVWIKHVAQADLAEISTGNLAQQKGTSAGVKSLGLMLVTDHTAHLAQVKDLAGRVNAAVPNAPAPWQQWQAAVLAGFSGTAFDQQWISAQIADHQSNIDETQDEIALGCNKAVRALAAATLPVLQKHLAEAQSLAGTATGTSTTTSGTGIQAGTGTQTGTSGATSGSSDSSSNCDGSDDSGSDDSGSSSSRHQHQQRGDDGCCQDDSSSGSDA